MSKKGLKKTRSNKNTDLCLISFINKELHFDKKKREKYCSQLELKVYKDKEINKLQPIKEKSKKYVNKNNKTYKRDSYSFIQNDVTSNNDSTLFNLISEISKV